MTAAIFKTMLLAFTLNVLSIPFGILGRWFIGRDYTTQETWTSIVTDGGTLLFCALWGYLETTDFVKKLTGVISAEDSRLEVRIATAAPAGTIPEAVKEAAKVFRAEVEQGMPKVINEAQVARVLNEITPPGPPLGYVRQIDLPSPIAPRDVEHDD